jgi:dynein assembly factor 6, axonemal
LEDPNAIWAPDEVCDVLEIDADDGRTVPEYSFHYKQAVQTGDVYLALDPMGKDPTSTSCEDLVLTVELPDAVNTNDIDVDLVSNSITLLTAKQYVASSFLAMDVPAEDLFTRMPDLGEVVAVD